jgi:hypothetical protein
MFFMEIVDGGKRLENRKGKVRDFFCVRKDVVGCCMNILRIFGENYFMGKFMVDLILQLIA